jgi:peptidoglycan/LPS O-acetylase OafA/YrhL
MNYIKQITFLRFLAALLVVIFHFGKNTWPFNLVFISPIIKEGSIAVSFFFFLSGVVLAFNYLEKPKFNVKSFFFKRLARIFPLYILAFVSTLILGMVFNNAFPRGSSIILQLLSLQAWFPGICLEINFPAWSISVEIFFYLMFPFILRIMNKIGHLKSIILIVTVWLFSTIQHYLFIENLYVPNNSEIDHFIQFFPLWHFNTFLMGILCAKYILRVKESKYQYNLKPSLLFAIGSISFLLILGTENFIKPYTHNGLMSPVFFLIIAGLSLDNSWLTNFLGNKVFILLGNSSYAIYIIQWPVYIILSAILGIKTLEGFYFYLYLSLLITISIVVYILYEKKMRKLIIDKFINKLTQ